MFGVMDRSIHGQHRVAVRYGVRCLLVLWSLCVLAISPEISFAETALEKLWVAKVVSLQGRAHVRRKGSGEWQPIRLEDRFIEGDMIQLEAKSRAAFVLRNESTLRVDQHTTLIFKEADRKKPFVIQLIDGAVHFFSRMNRSLRLITPFVNGAVEGTEFFARVDADQTAFSLFEGKLNVSNANGTVRLSKNQSVVAKSGQPPTPVSVIRPCDAVQWTLYYPTIIDFTPEDFSCDESWCEIARQSVAHWREGDLRQAMESLSNISQQIDDPRYRLYRSVLLLSVGRVDDAMIDLQPLQSVGNEKADATALLALIAMVQNEKEKADELVAQAMAGSRMGGATVDLANTYVQQAFFNLDGALASAREAVRKEPNNALAWARLSELYLSVGERAKALDAGERAVQIRPMLAQTQIILGFSKLAQMNTAQAKSAFSRAITLDSAAPMARLGLGLAIIRDGQLDQGRKEIEIAAALDPASSLIRSYLGKAYFEEKRDEPARVQLAMAKELDPADPTPWYYDALRKQSLNRPVEALRDLKTSMALNDNRAVYRSRLLLDQDLAARSAGIGRIYRDLGFQQLALVQGWNSVNLDPTNYSAHRFLADNYSVLPRHEIARVSELLQSQLLQPLNVTPIQPSLAETGNYILEGTEPSAQAFNEFSPLFLRNRLDLQTSGVAGTQGTWGDELVHSGIWNRFSYSIGQFHYESDGYRENNDRWTNLYNGFAQVSLTPGASLMAEVRQWNVKQGDLFLRFDPDDYYESYRFVSDRRSFRIGGHWAPNQKNHILGTVIFSQLDGKVGDNLPQYGFSYTVEEELDGMMAELQHLFRSPWFHLIDGIGFFHSGKDQTTDYDGSFAPSDSARKTKLDHTNPYLYAMIHLPVQMTWTVGASMDLYDSTLTKEEQFNPKFGVTWRIAGGTTVRAAAFRTFNRDLIAGQTLEPTQVAGFSQFYDDGNRTEAWHYGGAVDQEFGHNLFAGIEYIERDLTVSSNYKQSLFETDWDETSGRGYLFWTPHHWVSTSVAYGYSLFERAPQYVGPEQFTTLTTHKIPIGLNLFHPIGLFIRFTTSYVDQSGDFGNPWEAPTVHDSDRFWVVDTTIGYRLPKRLGIISLECKNLLDEGFHFQDTNPDNPEIIPERSFLSKITLAF